MVCCRQQAGADQGGQEQTAAECPGSDGPGDGRCREAEEADHANRTDGEGSEDDRESERRRADCGDAQAKPANRDTGQQIPERAPVLLAEGAASPDEQAGKPVIVQQDESGRQGAEIEADDQAGKHHGEGAEGEFPRQEEDDA